MRKTPRLVTVLYYSLTHAVGGKTRSRFLKAEQADLVRQQIDAGRKFRGRVDALWEACEEWADSRLAEPSGSSEEPKDLVWEMVEADCLALGVGSFQHAAKPWWQTT